MDNILKFYALNNCVFVLLLMISQLTTCYADCSAL